MFLAPLLLLLQTPVIDVEDRMGLDVSLDSVVRYIELPKDGRWARVVGERGEANFDVRTGKLTHRKGLRFVPDLIE